VNAAAKRGAELNVCRKAFLCAHGGPALGASQIAPPASRKPSRSRAHGHQAGALLYVRSQPWMSLAPYNGPRTQPGMRMSYSAEAQEKRDMAARARRLAGSLLVEADREGLMRTAQQLEEEAIQIESQSRARAAKGAKAPSEPQR
jgi:hypothetical protein